MKILLDKQSREILDYRDKVKLYKFGDKWVVA